MGRKYVVSFEDVTISAVQDLVAIEGAANKMLRVVSVKLGVSDSTLPTSQMLKTRCRLLPATFTSGSGGSAATPQKLSPGDAAASFAAEVNNTVKATTSTTAAVLYEGAFHVFSGEEHHFQTPPEIPPNAGFVYELIGAPSAAVKMSGQLVVEELG